MPSVACGRLAIRVFYSCFVQYYNGRQRPGTLIYMHMRDRFNLQLTRGSSLRCVHNKYQNITCDGS
jgi:hypothetical protein